MSPVFTTCISAPSAPSLCCMIGQTNFHQTNYQTNLIPYPNTPYPNLRRRPIHRINLHRHRNQLIPNRLAAQPSPCVAPCQPPPPFPPNRPSLLRPHRQDRNNREAPIEHPNFPIFRAPRTRNLACVSNPYARTPRPHWTRPPLPHRAPNESQNTNNAKTKSLPHAAPPFSSAPPRLRVKIPSRRSYATSRLPFPSTTHPPTRSQAHHNPNNPTSLTKNWIGSVRPPPPPPISPSTIPPFPSSN
jgi:hypothetical protein